MSQPLIVTLLLCVFVLPILGAVVLRLLTPRLAPVQLYGAAALLLGVVIASVLVLVRSDIPSLQIGNLSILLPVTAPDDFTPRPVPTPAEQPPVPFATSAPVTATDTLTATVPPLSTSAPVTATAALTGTAVLTVTVLPTDTATIVPPTAAATEVPTVEPTVAPTATPEPTAIPPTAAPAPPAAQRKYTVQPGDTLLSIAKKFNTTVTAIVEANKLTPQQADALHVGQVLVIP